MAARLLYDVQQRYKPRIYREFLGAEPYTESEFQARYRFSKESIQILTNLLNDDLKRPTNRSHAIPVETQIKIALRYYASGSFMQVIGDTFGYDKSTVSRIIQAVTGAISAHGADFLRWPDETTKPAIINGFYNIARFPCVIGAVDGTHIRIQAPSDNEYAFVNRKNFHSINVQGICDHEGKFTNIVAKWPGSTHDSFIFRNSDVGIHLDQNHRGFDVDGLLLGDSGYACKPYLMTPYLRPSTRHQERFNSAQTRTRSVIERTFGRWKRRFHLLHSEIRLTPDRVCKIVIACAILHNFAILQREPMIDDREVEEIDIGQDLGRQDGTNVRNLIATTYF
ncbi:HARBI1 [Mytilus edulis]|uniref:Putative nuclease HARBI1 n=1 Tax=Mytilus edulis TaxID=6550 RepID=A0A8S3VJP7_MYTED|nr:HARBI1 [Mytilus edulis]